MLQIAQALLPLAALVALGALLFKTGFFQPTFRQGLDRLVYWVALPALIVHVLADAPAVGGTAVRMSLALAAATVGTAVLAVGVAAAMRLPRTSIGVMVQAAFRGNLAFVGLPAIALATGGDSATLAKAALVFAPIVVLYNVLAVVGLVAAQHRFDAALPIKMIKSLVTNPLLLSCVLGLFLWNYQLTLPGPVDTTLKLLGAPAAPLALLSLGGALVSFPVGRHLGAATAASVLKCAVLPALTWCFAAWLGLPAVDRQVAMIFAACPTAVASYVLATQLKGDPALAAASIVVSTLLSGLALASVLAIT